MRRSSLFKTFLSLALLGVVTVGISSCGTKKTEYIRPGADDGDPVMGLDYRDFNQASSEMIQSLIASGKLNRSDGNMYVMAKSDIYNDTTQRIDTDQLMAKIEEELLNSGLVVMTSAVGVESARDDLVYGARDDLRNNPEFDQRTVPGQGNLIAPDLSISGKIFERIIPYDKKTNQVEYYFQLRITDLNSGLRYWQKESFVGKRGSNKTFNW